MSKGKEADRPEEIIHRQATDNNNKEMVVIEEQKLKLEMCRELMLSLMKLDTKMMNIGGG